jgi:hypothetical protein
MVLKPDQLIHQQEDAARYADVREKAFEENVARYRQAARKSVKSYEVAVAADEKEHAPEMHQLVEHAMEHAVANSDGGSDSSVTFGGSVVAAEPSVQKSSKHMPVAETRASGVGTGGAQSALDAVQKREIKRQLDFKTRVKEESKKAASERLQRKQAARDALEKMHSEVHARKAKEEASRAAWKKKREERQAVQKVLAAIGNNNEWPSEAFGGGR